MEQISKNRFMLILAVTFFGSTMGGVIYHALTCKSCKGEKGVAEVAKASADMNGQTMPRVVP